MKLNFTSISVWILLHLEWLTIVTISLRCCFVIVFSYSHRVSLLALQTLRLAYCIPPEVLVYIA